MNLSSKEIVIQTSDKGNSVVFINRDDYIKLMEPLTSDPEKLHKLLVPENKEYNLWLCNAISW